jgi:hypothetical protein
MQRDGKTSVIDSHNGWKGCVVRTLRGDCQRIGFVRTRKVTVALVIGILGFFAVAPAAAAQPAVIPGDGTFIVGQEIQPGTYATRGGQYC